MYRLEPEHWLVDRFFVYSDEVEKFSNSDAVQEKAKELLEEGKADRVSIWQMVCETDDPMKVST